MRTLAGSTRGGLHSDGLLRFFVDCLIVRHHWISRTLISFFKWKSPAPEFPNRYIPHYYMHIQLSFLILLPPLYILLMSQYYKRCTPKHNTINLYKYTPIHECHVVNFNLLSPLVNQLTMHCTPQYNFASFLMTCKYFRKYHSFI